MIMLSVILQNLFRLVDYFFIALHGSNMYIQDIHDSYVPLCGATEQREWSR
jgi:hypothetical protein